MTTTKTSSSQQPSPAALQQAYIHTYTLTSYTGWRRDCESVCMAFVFGVVMVFCFLIFYLWVSISSCSYQRRVLGHMWRLSPPPLQQQPSREWKERDEEIKETRDRESVTHTHTYIDRYSTVYKIYTQRYYYSWQMIVSLQTLVSLSLCAAGSTQRIISTSFFCVWGGLLLDY